MTTIKRSYSELIEIPTFDERFKYLSLKGSVGDFTFNGHRYLNQKLYRSEEWKSVRRRVIIRDNGCDLGCEDHPILGSVLIHHINPITIDDIVDRRRLVFDPENLICVSFDTHNAIHYGKEDILVPSSWNARTKNDTCLWR